MKNKLSVLLAIAFVLATGVTAGALPVALQSYTEIEITDGNAVVSGEVSNGHNIFGFEAFAGDLLTLNIDVTAILPGSENEDDDTQLFLFDEWGALLAENDDAADNNFQSLIDDFFVKQDGVYFVGVTTFDNPPPV
ncbi:PPC domain-containing protein [Desulfococcaceae bacterium HSG9]|nr:PPC domain-containing protein [Desulfococcaceae bacterium HSG9]